MNIGIFFPESNARSSGNRITAARWADILRNLGHHVLIDNEYRGEQFDLVICLHVFKTAEIAKQIQSKHPSTRLAIAITGTDMYSNDQQKSQACEQLSSVDHIICLNPRTQRELPAQLKKKAVLILQSAAAAEPKAAHDKDSFTVIVSGHLRSEKDPLRAAAAVRLLPELSKVCLRHFGGALEAELVELAKREMNENPRYQWFEEVAHAEVLTELAGADLLVQSSRVEGAPAVISEAIVAERPIIISNIPGLVGLLGDDYPAVFEVGDTRKLAELIERCESDQQWYASLVQHIIALKPLFERRAEIAAWQGFLG